MRVDFSIVMPSVSLSPAWWIRLRRLSLRCLRACAWLLGGGASILLVAWLVLQWGILPRLELWRPQIETWCSERLKLDVHIGAITLESDLWAPTLTLSELRFSDAAGHPVLQLQRLQARLVPGSLLPRSLSHWEPVFAELHLDGLDLLLRRDEAARLWIAGLPIDAGTPAASKQAAGATPPALRWLLRQGLVQLRGAGLEWRDELRGAPPLRLESVNLQLRRRALGHELQIDAAPPPAWRAKGGENDRWQLQGRWTRPLLTTTGLVRPDDWRHWDGRFSVTLAPTELRHLHDYLDLPAQRLEGALTLQGELALTQGRPTSISATTRLQDLRLQWRSDLEPLQLQEAATQLTLERTGRGYRAELARLQLRTVEGRTLPASRIGLQVERDQDGRLAAGTLDTGPLDLAFLVRASLGLGLNDTVQQLITDMAPQGQLRTFALQWRGPPDALAHYEARGEVTELRLRAAAVTPAMLADATPGRPGLSHADVSFSLDEKGGQARLQLDQGALEFPGVFETPRVEMQQLDSQWRWQLTPHADRTVGVEVEVVQARFANADAAGEFSGRWHTGQGPNPLPGRLDLQARLSRADATQVHRYLPIGIPVLTRHYVRDAVLAGTSQAVEATLHGDLDDFPYTRPGSGEFTIRAVVEAGRFAYAPAAHGAASEWPLLTDLNTELLFTGQGMTLRHASARLGELGSRHFELREVHGQIADFAAPVLHIGGRGQGPVDDMFTFLRASPVGGWLGGGLDPATGSGPATLQLTLDLPLDQLAQTRVQGKVQLDGNEVRLHPDTPTLADLHAGIDFSETTFSIGKASATALGGRLDFSGGLQPDGQLRFSGSGQTTAEGLQQAPALPAALRQLAGQLSGSAPYQLELGFVAGQPDVTVHSPLLGLAAAWPAPLGKPAQEARALLVRVQPHPPGAAGAQRNHWHVSLGDQLDLQLLLENHAGQVRLLQGGIGLGVAAPQASAGLLTRLNWPDVPLEDWLTWFAALPPSPDGSASDAGERLLPERIEIVTDRFALPGLPLTRLRAVVQHPPGRERHWQVDLTADQVAGQVLVDLPAGPEDSAAPMRIRARLDRLALNQDAGAESGSRPAATRPEQLDRSCARLPALDLIVQQLDWQGRPLGRLAMQAGPPVDAGQADTLAWRVHELTLANPDGQLLANGLWSCDSRTPAGRTALTWRVDLANSGALLRRFGLADVLRGGSGRLNGQLSWWGKPWAPDLGSLSGQVKLALGSGQVLQADPGITRLFGILTLQSLPRRLALDFRDVTQQGFSFDQIDGDARIQQGIARTQNLHIKGVQATVLAEGSANLSLGTQDLHVRVVPDLNAGAASLAYAMVNPAVGLSTLIGQWFLLKPLADAATREFHVTGRFGQPQIESVGSSPSTETLPQPDVTTGSTVNGTKDLLQP